MELEIDERVRNCSSVILYAATPHMHLNTYFSYHHSSLLDVTRYVGHSISHCFDWSISITDDWLTDKAWLCRSTFHMCASKNEWCVMGMFWLTLSRCNIIRNQIPYSSPASQYYWWFLCKNRFIHHENEILKNFLSTMLMVQVGEKSNIH